MQFSELQKGGKLESDRFSDPGNPIGFEKIGDEAIEEYGYLQAVIGEISYKGNARRQTDGQLFEFKPNEEVYVKTVDLD